MKVEYSFVDFGAPVFCKGKNFGNKVYAIKDGAKLYHDTDLPWVKMVMEFKGATTHFGQYLSADMIPMVHKVFVPTPPAGTKIVTMPYLREESSNVQADIAALQEEIGKPKITVPDQLNAAHVGKIKIVTQTKAQPVAKPESQDKQGE